MRAWPYAEGLRLDEAMHPLALPAFGLFAKRPPTLVFDGYAEQVGSRFRQA